MNNKLLVFIFMVPFWLSCHFAKSQSRVLMVLSSYGKDSGKSRPGYEFDEFTQAYLIFKNNGLLIDIASPKGGEVEADKFSENKIYNKIFLENHNANNLLKNTKSTASIISDDYDAIYIVGGKGAMFDLPFDPSLQEIILDLYKRDGTIISSVCHGMASLINVKDENGFIVKNVSMTGFSNKEEDIFDSPWVPEFPFKLEDKLISRGVNFEKADFMLSNVVVSGKFITGQNPYSTNKSAEEVVKALGIIPVERELYKDEKSIYLINDVLTNAKTVTWAQDELSENIEKYDISLIANYGYFKMMLSKNDEIELKKGLVLMELTSPHYFNPKLQLFLAETYISLNLKEKAMPILEDLISKNLLKPEAQKILIEIN